MKASISSGMLLLFLLIVLPAAGKDIRATVVYDDVATEINPAQMEDASGQLWITTADLTRATRFEVKPQGVCRDELCFPLPKARQQEFLRKNGDGNNKAAGKTWFNLTAFAALVHQSVAHDDAQSMWYFGLRSDQHQRLASLRAPDFTLPDMNGNMHSLSDYRGKKVFLVTWASW
jgi:AhpC/TSA family